MKVQIPFQQILSLIKTLTPSQKEKLKRELEKPETLPDPNLIQLLLNGPVYTKEDISRIEENRRSISEWRKKP